MLQHSSCVRCKTSIAGNPKEHLVICEKMARLDEVIEGLYGDGYDTLSFEQIKLLFDLLLTTELCRAILLRIAFLAKHNLLQRKEI